MSTAIHSPIARLIVAAQALADATASGDPVAIRAAQVDLLPLLRRVTPGQAEALALSAQLLTDAYHRGSEEGEHPGTVEWSEIDEAHAVALIGLGRAGALNGGGR